MATVVVVVLVLLLVVEVGEVVVVFWKAGSRRPVLMSTKAYGPNGGGHVNG